MVRAMVVSRFGYNVIFIAILDTLKFVAGAEHSIASLSYLRHPNSSAALLSKNYETLARTPILWTAPSWQCYTFNSIQIMMI